jgi:hypothetical protein
MVFQPPAICKDRLTVRADGRIQYELKNPFRRGRHRNGTTHILFSPLDFLSKLAALVPRPRHNLVRYHGVFARGCHQPNSTLRKLIIPKSTKRVRGKENSKPDKMSEFEDAVSRNELVAPLTWAQRRDGEPLKRVFERAAFGSLIQT